jgi:hypothetical protein
MTTTAEQDSSSQTRIISYSGLDETYYVSVPDRRRGPGRKRPATVAIPKEALQPESDKELCQILDQAHCDLHKQERQKLREKSQRFSQKR